MMSWALAIGLSIPISIVLAHNIGESFMSYPMPASYSVGGVLAWLVNTAASAVIGLIVGAVVVAVGHGVYQASASIGSSRR